MTRPQAQAPERSEPPTPPPPPPAVNKVPPHETEPGESFWSRVKRGLTGGSDKA
jgi:hypothetical protein